MYDQRDSTSPPRQSPWRRPAGSLANLAAIIVFLAVGPAVRAETEHIPPHEACRDAVEEVELEIVGPPGVSESDVTTMVAWAANLVRRPCRYGLEGYEPTDSRLKTTWESTIEFVWSFGDGTIVSSGERTVASHAYDEVGTYEIEVTARELTDPPGPLSTECRQPGPPGSGRWCTSATREFRVVDLRPSIAAVHAVEIDPAASLVELTAVAIGPLSDRSPARIRWTFGDETTEEGGWKVTHRYPKPGTYEVQVEIFNPDAPDGGEPWIVACETRDRETRECLEPRHWKIRLAGPTEPQDPWEEPDDPTAVTVGRKSGFSGQIAFRGSPADIDAALPGVGTPMTAEVRPFAGVLLGKIKPQVCRLTLLGWDPDSLSITTLIADFARTHGDADGERMTVRPRVLSVAFLPTGDEWWDTYTKAYSSRFKPDPMTGLGESALPSAKGKLQADGELDDPDDPRISEEAVNQELGAQGVDFIRVGPRERQDATGRPPAASSPLGLDEGLGFELASGETASLSIVPGEYLLVDLGTVRLENDDEDSTIRQAALSGSFMLDLDAARRDGYVGQADCFGDPQEFELEFVTPEDEKRHVSFEPNVGIRFNRPYDPETLDSSTFQLTYPDAGGTATEVPVRLHRSPEGAVLRPAEPLLGGITYTARVKTGPEGVKSARGEELSATAGDGEWATRKFTTRVDFETGVNANLSCHVFQTVRDAPLIVGKPAVARIYAEWTPHENVASWAQVMEFEADVTLYDDDYRTEFTTPLGHRFMRDDLVTDDQRRNASQTANVFFTPVASEPEFRPVRLEVTTDGSLFGFYEYGTVCSTPTWDHAPELVVEYHVLGINDWEPDHPDEEEPANRDAARAEALPLIAEAAREAERMAQQMLPFHKVTFHRGNGVVTYPRGLDPWDEADKQRVFDEVGALGSMPRSCHSHTNLGGGPALKCPARVLVDYREPATDDPDIIIGIYPVAGSGGAAQWLGRTEMFLGGAAERGVIVLPLAAPPAGPPTTDCEEILLADRPPMTADELANVMVHEIGHTLWLEHNPYVPNDVHCGARILAQLYRAGQPPSHLGIEGFRIDLDGGSGVNKSSTEGNGEGPRLSSLMHPIATTARDVFPTRHQYLYLQEMIETRPELSRLRRP